MVHTASSGATSITGVSLRVLRSSGKDDGGKLTAGHEMAPAVSAFFHTSEYAKIVERFTVLERKAL